MPTMTGIIAMRAQVSAIGTLKVSGGLFGGLAMQLRVDALRELTRNAFNGCDVVDRRRRKPAHSAETCKQPLPALWSDTFHGFELRTLARLRATRAHSGDRESVCLVANLRDQHQCLC